MDFGILLGLAYQHFVIELNAHLAAKGFSAIKPTYGYVFRALGSERLTTAQLAASLHITNQGMAKMVDEMVASGYVERHADPADARVKLLDLSAHGKAALAAARKFHADFESRLSVQLGERKVATTRAVLTELVGGASEDLTRTLRPF
ncbi:MAG TPA: MarR family transcriptional regulator [Micromonosporaceae bacterium]|nr:MarR family transcriptional regulator [Micromonosporaceae bacterium]HCU49137.1 MarR family transcriptional regulator [Micromonosporaceae bacterium]